MLVILVRGKGEECRRFEFAREIVTIGRAEGNDVVLPAAHISKRHARLSVSRDGVLLTDIRSTNGTYVNGRKLLIPVVVTHSDRIHIGDFVLAIEEPAGPAARGPSGGTPSSLSPLFPRAPDVDGRRLAEQRAMDLEAGPQYDAAPTPVLPAPAVMARGWSDPPRHRGTSASSGGWSGGGSSGGARRGRGNSLRLPWLDEWLLGDLDTHGRRGAAYDLAQGPAEPVVALVRAHLPPLVELGAQVVLGLCAEAEAGAAAQRTAARGAALEVSLCFPDGGLEATEAEQGLLQVTAGRRSAELSFVLLAVAAGPVRIEIGLSHRGARLATLVLRATVGPPGAAVPAREARSAAVITSLQREVEPQAVLRVREFSRRLWTELLVVHGETTQALASGDMVTDRPLRDRTRALYAAPEVEVLGQIHGRLREAALRSLGETLAAQLLPAAVREALQGLPAGVWLHIDAADPWLPWELLCLGRGTGAMFFAERFALTRGGLGTQTSRFGLMPRLLLTPPGTERLGRREQQALTVLDPHLRQIHRLSEVRQHLRRPEIAGWHLSGHGGFYLDQGDEGGLHLQDGVLTSAHFPQCFHEAGSAPPGTGSFFFINVSGRGPAATPLCAAGTAPWVERLLSAGAGAVVAPSWPVPGERADRFAEAFYRAWASGHPLTLAAAEAREQIRAEGDVAWLSYAIYGVPGARLE